MNSNVENENQLVGTGENFSKIDNVAAVSHDDIKGGMPVLHSVVLKELMAEYNKNYPNSLDTPVAPAKCFLMAAKERRLTVEPQDLTRKLTQVCNGRLR